MQRKHQASAQKGTRKSAFFVSPVRRVPRPVHGPLKYIAFNKPYGVLSQFTSEAGKRTLAEFGLPKGLYPIGRLDEDSEGLLLLTNDNALKHDLTNPQAGHRKTYWVQVERIPDESALVVLRKGIELSGEQTLPADVRLLSLPPTIPDRPVPIRHRINVPTAWLEISIVEGKNRQVRRMTAAVGHPTLRLVRIAILGMKLEGLKPGAWKYIERSEVQKK